MRVPTSLCVLAAAIIGCWQPASAAPSVPLWGMDLQLPPGDPQEPGRADFEKFAAEFQAANGKTAPNPGRYLQQSANEGFPPALVAMAFRYKLAGGHPDPNAAIRLVMPAAKNRFADAEWIIAFSYGAQIATSNHKVAMQLGNDYKEFASKSVADGSAMSASMIGITLMPQAKSSVQIEDVYILCSIAVDRGSVQDRDCVEKMKKRLSPAEVSDADDRFFGLTRHPDRMYTWMTASVFPSFIGRDTKESTDPNLPQVVDGGPSDQLLVELCRRTLHALAEQVGSGTMASKMHLHMDDELADAASVFGFNNHGNTLIANQLTQMADGTVITVAKKAHYEGVWNVYLRLRNRGDDSSSSLKMLATYKGGVWTGHIPQVEQMVAPLLSSAP
jgi:hypothetical protein